MLTLTASIAKSAINPIDQLNIFWVINYALFQTFCLR